MRLLRSAVLLLLIVAVPLFLITTNLRIVINSGWLYSYGFGRYEIPAATGIEKPELMRSAQEIKRYFNNSEKRLDIHAVLNGREVPLYNQREVDHMEDVKGLVKGLAFWQRIAFLYMAALVIAGMAFMGRRWVLSLLRQGLLWGSVVTVALIAAAGIGSLIGFDRLFTMFHQISFSNNLWQLDPTTDRLIQMFPEGFFMDATLIAAGLTLVQALLTAAVILVLQRYRPTQPERQVRSPAPHSSF